MQSFFSSLPDLFYEDILLFERFLYLFYTFLTKFDFLAEFGKKKFQLNKHPIAMTYMGNIFLNRRWSSHHCIYVFASTALQNVIDFLFLIGPTWICHFSKVMID
jgi:hypothetical protein